MSTASIRLNPSRTRSLSYIALSVALIAACTWIAIPTAVPFTMQTFAIFAILSLLGGKLGTLSILCYLTMGLVGLPVFSGFRGGFSVLFGATGGYLVGFLVMGLLYWALTALLGQGLWKLLALVLGLLALYLFGTVWFLQVYASGSGDMGFMGALSVCVFPFVFPDLAKLGLALLLTKRLAPALRL